jgi:hypothetical protein
MSKRGQPRSTASRASSLIGALLGCPALRDELRETAQRPAALELVDAIDDVALGIDAESKAVVRLNGLCESTNVTRLEAWRDCAPLAPAEPASKRQAARQTDSRAGK